MTPTTRYLVSGLVAIVVVVGGYKMTDMARAEVETHDGVQSAHDQQAKTHNRNEFAHPVMQKELRDYIRAEADRIIKELKQ